MKETEPERDGDTLEEYDFTAGVRGKYASRYAEGSNMVLWLLMWQRHSRIQSR
jgi:hypothetical protein